jgi:hypothetical protein
MVMAKDSKGLGPKYNPDPNKIINETAVYKRIVFIRHGESDWNNVFNKGINISFIFRLISSLKEELFLFWTSSDSKFIDSPLNHEGIEQALELRRYIEATNHPECSKTTNEVISMLRGDSDTPSVIVSSTLRRAIATTTLGLWPRVDKTEEKVIVLSSLQEVSRNVDTRALSNPKEVADLPFARIKDKCKSTKRESFDPDAIYDATENYGNKRFNFYGILRLRAFNEWAFKRSEDTIIVGGHSLWFKYFFQTYLPHSSKHDAKNKKISNSGIVTFIIYRSYGADGSPLYRIDESTIETVYGGFTTK